MEMFNVFRYETISYLGQEKMESVTQCNGDESEHNLENAGIFVMG